MRKCAVCILLFLLLSGCSQQPDELETGMELRSKLLQASKCSFVADITADYGDKVHSFSMDCIVDSQGDLTFTVIKPDTISGISGTVNGKGGDFTFDEKVLHFELMAEDTLSPISAPWILMKTLRSGYIASACTENSMIRLSVDDSFDEDPLRLDIWLNAWNTPERADILHDGRRILSVSVADFEIL